MCPRCISPFAYGSALVITALLLLSGITVSLPALHFNLTRILIVPLLFCHCVYPDSHCVKREFCNVAVYFFRHAMHYWFHLGIVLGNMHDRKELVGKRQRHHFWR